MRRAVLLSLLVSAACSGAPEVELPNCIGATDIEGTPQHSVTVDARGHVWVDGRECATEDAMRSAFERLMKTMHNDYALASRVGKLYAVDEPLLARIDASTKFDDAARVLSLLKWHATIFRRWVVVHAASTGVDQCIPVDEPPSPHWGDGPLNEDWEPHSDSVGLWLYADHASWKDDTGNDFPWMVNRRQRPQIHTSSFCETWGEVRDLIAEIPPVDRDFWIQGTLASDTPWSQVASLLAEARHLHAVIEIYPRSDAAPTNR